MKKPIKVLWLTNIYMPQVAKEFNKEKSFAGGWLAGLFNGLKEEKEVQLSICFPLYGETVFKKVLKNDIAYYGVGVSNIPYQYSEETVLEFKKIIDEEQPDMVHIFGAEFAHTLAMVNAFNNPKKTVISIQGLCSVYADHYLEGLPEKAIKQKSLAEIINKRGLTAEKDDYIKRGKLEVEALKKVNHVIGRTSWDQACASHINAKARYHFCNESLREKFYHHKWDIKNIERFSIFLSQGNYPIKGLHYMIKALSIIVKKQKNTKLYIAGGKIIDNKQGILSRLKTPSYPRYINHLINKYQLNKNIEFLGGLNEAEMCGRFLKSHVFVSPSTIENSPNSVGEAMLLGVPCVASDVGGVLDLMVHQSEGFVYPSSAPYMLAHYVLKLFKDDKLCKAFSKKSSAHASKTHDKKNNSQTLTKIYQAIVREDK